MKNNTVLLKRGMFLSIVMIIGAISNMLNQNRYAKTMIIAFIVALGIGILQFISSIYFRHIYGLRISLLCLILELVYYVVAEIFLLITTNQLPILVFGTIVFLGMLVIIGSTLRDIFLKNI